MAQPSTLYRFRVDLSDVDRGLYDQLDFRTAMHPSESIPYLFTRAIAFALNSEEGLEFSPMGLGDPDAPAISIHNAGSGRTSLWIEIGNPSPKKLHKAAKAAELVKVYTYKDPTLIIKECQGQGIYRAESIEIYSIDPQFLETIGADIQREIRWSLLRHDDSLTISWGHQHLSCDLKKYSL